MNQESTAKINQEKTAKRTSKISTSPKNPSRKQNKISIFRKAEEMSHDLSLLPGKRPHYFDESSLQGLLGVPEIEKCIKHLKTLDVDRYIEQVVLPSENQKRTSTPEVIKLLGGKLINEDHEGPLYIAEMEFVLDGMVRRLGFIAQNHKEQNGVWYPKHHREAAERIKFFAAHSMPLVTFMDTPGAAANEEANLDNQAHSISFLLTEMANLQLPTVGIVFGCGYSGGAIPLATTNILLSVREGVFNTIHPKGLSNIARKYDFSWQECAQYIGVSSYEMYANGYFDGIIDASLQDPASLSSNISKAILSAVQNIENNSKLFLKEHPFFFNHYQENINHYLNPSELLLETNRITRKSPTGTLNIFGSVYRFMRYLKLRQRIESRSVLNYSRLSTRKKKQASTNKEPTGMLRERLSKERSQKFEKWIHTPLELRYHEGLLKAYQRFEEAREDREKDRGRIVSFFMGDPKENFSKSVEELGTEVLLYLYNYWKDAAPENLLQLHEYLLEVYAPEKGRASTSKEQSSGVNLIEVLLIPELYRQFQSNYQNIILFDLLYNSVVKNLPTIANELKGSNCISQSSVERLFDSTFDQAMIQFEQGAINVESEVIRERFFTWLMRFTAHKNCDTVMASISSWKRTVFPRLSPPLFGVVRYYFSGLLPSLHQAQQGKSEFQGKITPRNIGIKDFWNRLDQAYKDLLIHNLLTEFKKTPITPTQILDHFFGTEGGKSGSSTFKELYADRITANPVRFPGFRNAIEQALDRGITPCGVLTGLATYDDGSIKSRVGVVLSNARFQAGAFDMASCEKVCRLLDECARRKLPVILFISSSGMQTKEGAGALFSMSILNDRITRFIKDQDLPILCFGFRDCVGGAQASFVTHFLVRTYYLSGAQIPFAGQLVVESNLPATATLANYRSTYPGTMDALVRNPFDREIDSQLKAIDPNIPEAQMTVREIISRVLGGEYCLSVEVEDAEEDLALEPLNLTPIERVLIHARGCTATRLVQGAQDAGKEVVLVQSDPDMESYPAQLLREQDRLVCIGGNTSQESYLNAMSVIRIAEQEEADSIHPGIGFLSESPRYAQICREHGLNFVGPRAISMNLMGNKTNAISTARRLNIPVVPGSEGALTEAAEAQSVADEIGFPVLIKSAHGGGGKGIEVVWESQNFQSTFSRMSQEALSAFGNGDLYLEKFIHSMRHLEIQILRDVYENSQLIGVRDCSVQRNYQKVLEESAFALPESITKKLFEYAQALIDDIDYIGAGTVEFIYDLSDKSLYFMEMNTRLQVEHPVTEMVSGVDLVEQQFVIAEGGTIEFLEHHAKGHAMELRINAERVALGADGTLKFIPNPGLIHKLSFPDAPHVRVISSMCEGSVIPPYYDSLIAQVIAWGESREAVIQRLIEYMEQVEINGVSCNKAFLQLVLQDEEFQQGEIHTKFLEGFFKRINTAELIQQTRKDSGNASGSLSQTSIQIEGSKELKVMSPQMGGFYRSSSPQEPILVQEGQLIHLTDPLCVLESMKVFTELTLEHYKTSEGTLLYSSKHPYRIQRILAEDQQTVNQGDLLFIIEPVEE